MGLRATPLTALVFSAWGVAPHVDTGTAKSGVVPVPGNCAQAKWTFLALRGHSLLPPSEVPVSVSVSALQYSTQGPRPKALQGPSRPTRHHTNTNEAGAAVGGGRFCIPKAQGPVPLAAGRWRLAPWALAAAALSS
jgi:hypothetical protein